MLFRSDYRRPRRNGHAKAAKAQPVKSANYGRVTRNFRRNGESRTEYRLRLYNNAVILGPVGRDAAFRLWFMGALNHPTPPPLSLRRKGGK